MQPHNQVIFVFLSFFVFLIFFRHFLAYNGHRRSINNYSHD